MAATEELSPLTGAAKLLGTVSLALATFMNVLDTSIAIDVESHLLAAKGFILGLIDFVYS
jgi:hypothetical protein